MQNFKLGLTTAAIALGVSMAASAAFAQTAPMAPDESATMLRKPVPAGHTHGYVARQNPRHGAYRPLTVAAPVAPPPAGPSLTGVITAPITAAGSIAVAPLNGLSQAFGWGPVGGPAKPLPIVAKYAGVGPVTDSVNQGWAQPVPLSANGPVYKLEAVSNSGGVSPFTLIAAPITAATTLAAAPVNAVGGVLGAPPAPAPVF